MSWFRDRFLENTAPELERRAIEDFLTQATNASEPPDVAARRAIASLDGDGSALIGYRDPGGEPIRISLANESRHDYTAGTSGGGKTWSVLNTLDQRFRSTSIEAELLDPKGETFTEMQLCIARTWHESDEATRERIASRVYVIDWTDDKITPVDPLDIADDAISPAYAAELHTRITIKASDMPYTESLRQLLFMWDQLLIDRKFPDLYPFTLKFFKDRSFRSRILAHVKNADVRYYFSSLEQIVAKATIDAFLRRKWALHAFPPYRYATCIPPRDLARLSIPRTAPWTLANFATSKSQPASLGRVRFRWHAVRRLQAIWRRNPAVPLWFILEELLMLVGDDSDILEILNTSMRTARSAGVAIRLISQNLIPELPRNVVETILLNTQRWSIFATRPDEAELLFPHVLPVPGDSRSEGERKRAFLAEMQSLPRQHFYHYVKGHPAMRCRTPNLVHPTSSTGRSKDELLALFHREIGARSMISFRDAARLIDDWQRDVVGEAPTTDAGTPPAEGPRNLDELRKILGGQS